MGAILDEAVGSDMAGPLWPERDAGAFGKMGGSKSAGGDNFRYALLCGLSKCFRPAAELDEARDDLSCVR